MGGDRVRQRVWAGRGLGLPLRSHWTPRVATTRGPHHPLLAGRGRFRKPILLTAPLCCVRHGAGFRVCGPALSRDRPFAPWARPAGARTPAHGLSTLPAPRRRRGGSPQGCCHIVTRSHLLPGSRSDPCSFCSGDWTASSWSTRWTTRACGPSCRAAPPSCKGWACWPGGHLGSPWGVAGPAEAALCRKV